MKKNIIISLIFLFLGFFGGVFYREYTKSIRFVNVYTPLGLVHVHFLALGVILILVLGLVAKNLNSYHKKLYNVSLIGYSAGVFMTGVMLFVRGIFHCESIANSLEVSALQEGIISGISGISHIVLAVFLILIFISFLIKKKETSEIEGGRE